MTTRTSVAEKIRTGLSLFVALAALVFSFVINHVSRPPNSEANSLRKRILAEAGLREEELTSDANETKEAEVFRP
jgi:hypothetical protein